MSEVNGKKTEQQAAPEQDMNQLMQVRLEKLRELQAEGRDPFEITTYDATEHSLDIKEAYESYEGKMVSVAGRMMSKRIMGKASFCSVRDLRGAFLPCFGLTRLVVVNYCCLA